MTVEDVLQIPYVHGADITPVGVETLKRVEWDFTDIPPHITCMLRKTTEMKTAYIRSYRWGEVLYLYDNDRLAGAVHIERGQDNILRLLPYIDMWGGFAHDRSYTPRYPVEGTRIDNLSSVGADYYNVMLVYGLHLLLKILDLPPAPNDFPFMDEE